MAPRETPKATTKVQRNIAKEIPSKGRASPIGAIKKSTIIRKAVEKTPLKINNATVQTRQRTNTVPALATPKSKENKPAPLPSSVTKSAKKASWKRRPKPAHSGVPIPEKMRKLMEKQLKDAEFVI